MTELEELLKKAAEIDAADIFILPGTQVTCKTNGQMQILNDEKLMPDSAEKLISDIYALSGRGVDRLKQTGDDDFSFALPGLSRFRVNTYKQRGSLAAVIRIIKFGIPS